MQYIYQIFGAYYADDNADELKNDPIFTTVMDKDTLASQPTLSRFINRTDGDTLEQLNEIFKELRKRAYSVEKPKQVLFDIDTTLSDTYGKQEGSAFNYHYKAYGYHPFLCFDAFTGDLIKAVLRNGSEYCCKNVAEHMRPVLDEYVTEYPGIDLFLRGDSGFATDELYSLCEEYDVQYAIRLKENSVLHRLCSEFEEELYQKTTANVIDYAVVYGEFEYKAKSWETARRVACKIEKPYNQMTYLYTFVVTNLLELSSKDVISVYCKRGAMENLIKECKNGFDFRYASSSTMVVNANRLQIHGLAYNLFNWMRRLTFPKSLQKARIDTIRIKLVKIASRVVHKARYIYFKLCSSCPYKEEFLTVLENIAGLRPLLT